jgi:glycerol-3-phosphate dehydrogenase
LEGGERLYPEEIISISKNESIQFASDFFFRRSGAGVPGKPKFRDNIWHIENSFQN